MSESLQNDWLWSYISPAQEEVEVASVERGGVRYSREEAQTQAPLTSPWVSRWAQDVGRPAAQVSSYWMSGNFELSNSMATIDYSRLDGEAFTDWRSSESSRETASSFATTVDDSLSEGDGFIAQTPGEDGTRPVFIAGSEQGSEALHPVQGLESLSLTEDVEMTGCEPVGKLAEKQMDWEWSETSAQYSCNKSPPEPPFEIEHQLHPI